MGQPKGTTEPQTRRLARMLGTSSLGAALLLLLAWAPAARFAGGTAVLSAAVAVALLGALVAAVPTAGGLGGPPQRFVSGYFQGLTARFAITFAAALVVWRLSPAMAGRAFLLWVAAAQAILLALDTAVLLTVCKPTMRASA